jgi:hypothetical protein
MKCSECVCWLKNGLMQGECHKGPPAVVVMAVQTGLGQMGMTPVSLWPPTKADGWCLGFEGKVDAIQ